MLKEEIRTRIYRLRRDDTISQRIGQIVTQQNLAYNRGVDILRKAPEIRLWPRKDLPESFKARTSQWMKTDGRANAPAHLLIAGADQAWDDHDRLKRQRTLDRLSESEQTGGTEDLDRFQLKLRHRSRKHGRSVLTCHKPPVRLGSDRFGIPGVGDLVVHTKKEVPELDIRSFRLVEVRGERRGANGPFRKRRYAIHLNVVETYPEPAGFDSVGALEDVLGIKDDGDRLALSSGDAIAFGDSRGIRNERAMRSTAARKKKGSKRQHKLLKQVRKKEQRRRVERRRVATEAARVMFREKRPKVVAVSPDGCRATALPVKNVNSLTSRRHGPFMAYVLTETERTMITEANRQGIATYSLLPQTYEENDNKCRHRDGRDTQAQSRCPRRRRVPNTSQDTARDLQMRAFHYIGPAASRTLYTEESPMGRPVKPSRAARDLSCDTQGADKPTGDSGQIGSGPKLSPPNDLLGVSLQAGSFPGQGAQSQLVSLVSTQYIITDELISVINTINGEDFAYNTKRLRAEGMAMWATWATVNQRRILPADPASVANFIARLAELGHSTQTILGHLKGIVTYHALLGLDSPVTNQVTKVVQAIQRLHGRLGKQAHGLSRQDVKAIEQTVFTPLRRETPEQTRERGLKIIALVKLMRDCLLRRSEAASATWADISPYDDGAGVLFIKASKKDRVGKGDAQYVSQETMDALSLIRTGASDADTIFGWTADQISYRITQTMHLAVLNGKFSTHSMRRGMAQELTNANVTIDELKEGGRWDDDTIAVRYGLPDDPKKGAVAHYHALMAAQKSRTEE